MSSITVRAGSGAVKSFPFAAIPHALRRDPRLNTRAIVTAAAILEYARDKGSCWPSNGRLARDMGCSVGTARNGLASLLRAGWIAVKHGASNPTGRVIVLAWRRPTPATGVPADCAPPCQPIDGDGCAPIGTEASLKNRGEEERPSADEGPETPRPPAGEGEHNDVAELIALAEGGGPFAAVASKRLAELTPLPCPAEVPGKSTKVEESQNAPEPCKTRGPEDSGKVEESQSKSAATQVRVPQVPRPVVRAPAQVPGHAHPTMRKASQPQPCTRVASLVQIIDEAFQRIQEVERRRTFGFNAPRNAFQVVTHHAEPGIASTAQ